MTEAALRRRAGSPWAEFWRDLKHGHDLFETTRLPPHVLVCNGHYAFEPAAAGDGGDSGPLTFGCPEPATGATAAMASPEPASPSSASPQLVR